MSAKPVICIAILILAVILKFWLISTMEITDDPNDPFHYVGQIVENKGLCYGPGTGQVGKLFYDLGIPFRLGIEAAYLVTAFVVLAALIELPIKSYLATGLYVFVIFDPAVAELMSHIMSDQVWMIETLLGFSLLVFFARTSGKIRWACLAVAGLSLGYSCITRSIFVPLLIVLVAWAAISCGLLLLRRDAERTGFRTILLGGMFCVYSVGLFYYGTCFHNARYNGFHGLNALDCQEYRNFYVCLQSVGEVDGEPYYPVDDHRLSLVATAGPRSRWFVDQMAKDWFFRKTSMDQYGQPGVALAWFHWAVFETIDTDGDLDRTYAIFKDVEKEIAQAAQEGRLHVRHVLPLPDSRIPIVLSVLPHCFWHTAAQITSQPTVYAWAWGDGEPRFVAPDFTQALQRRTVTRSPFHEQIGADLCAVYSWIYAPLLPCLALAVAAFLVTLIRRWRELLAFSANFLTQQIFLIGFVIFYLWYTLFDASGLVSVERYLVFNNVMLPLLIVYYARHAYLLLTNRVSCL